MNHQWVGKKITDEMKYAVIDQIIYRILDISPNDTLAPNGVDILILQKADGISLGDEGNG